MFLSIFLVLFACTNGEVLVEPKFQVLTPDELMVEVPHYEDKKLVTFRIGVRRAGHDEDDLELGENNVDNNRVFIYDQRLKLKKGDVVNYLLAFKDKSGYLAQSGNYYFNGAYYKKPFARRQRLRRHLSSTEKQQENTVTEKLQENMDEAEEFDPTAPRFGGGYHPHHHWHRRGPGFNPFGPPRPYPGFPPQNGGGGPPFGNPGFGNPNFGGPNFGEDCNHGQDGRYVEKWRSSTTAPVTPLNFDLEMHCRICNSQLERGVGVTRRTTTTTEDTPDIDIRFAD